MKKLLWLALCLGALAGRARAQAAPAADLVVVRIVEKNTGHSTVIVTRGENKSEQLEFVSAFTAKNLLTGSERYHSLFASLYREGYKLTSTFSTAAGTVTLLFTKEQ